MYYISLLHLNCALSKGEESNHIVSQAEAKRKENRPYEESKTNEEMQSSSLFESRNNACRLLLLLIQLL